MPVSKKDLDEVFPPDEKFDDSGWKKVGGGGDEEAWDFESKAVIQGLYVEVRRNLGENESNGYIIENQADNRNYLVWGSTVLDRRFADDDNNPRIPVGSEVRIEYQGMKKSEKTGRTFKDFEVHYRNPMVEA